MRVYTAAQSYVRSQLCFTYWLALPTALAASSREGSFADHLTLDGVDLEDPAIQVTQPQQWSTTDPLDGEPIAVMPACDCAFAVAEPSRDRLPPDEIARVRPDVVQGTDEGESRRHRH